MSVVSINQPAYLPWLGYFHRIAISDVHIVLDHVQFEKNSFINRNKIRTKEGWCWLTLPVRTKGLFGNLEINKLKIDGKNNWKKKHWASILQNYSKAPYFKDYAWIVEDIYTKKWTEFNEMIKRITNNILNSLDINTHIMFSSDMDIGGKKEELILNLCKAVDTRTYISGPHGREYLNEEQFRANGIRVVYHRFTHPEYPQVYTPFVSHLSVIDLLFNCGPASLEFLIKDQI